MSEIRTNVTISGETLEYRSNIEISIVTLNSKLEDTHSSFRTNIDISTELNDGTISSIKTTLELDNISLDFYLVDMTKLNQSLLYFSKFFNMYFEPEVMWELLAQGTNEQINISHLTNALSNYVTLDNLSIINKYITSVNNTLSYHIYDEVRHLSQEEREFLEALMLKPPGNGDGDGDGLFEIRNIGTEEVPKYAVVPKRFENLEVGILSNTFITAQGKDDSDDSPLFNILWRWSDYDPNSSDVLSALLGYELRQDIDSLSVRIENLEQNGTGSSGGTNENIYLTKQEFYTLYFERDKDGNIQAKSGLWTNDFVTGGGKNANITDSIFTILDSWDKYNPDSNDALSANLGKELSDRIDSLENNSGNVSEEQLREYLKKSEASALYASKSLFNTLNTKVNDFLEGSDTDTIINKWKELEAFLEGQTESSTLADLLSIKADKQTVVDLQNYLNKLFTAELDSDGNLVSIKANAGLWTDSFITARGINGNLDGEAFVRLDRWEDYNANSDEGQVLSAKLGWELLQMVTNGSGSVDLTGYVKTEELNTKLQKYYTKTEVTTELSKYQTLISSSNKIAASNISGLASVAISGSYNDLSNKPTIPNLTGYAKESWVTSRGYITGINKSMVVTALNYTPYDSSNPNNYITSDALDGYATQYWVRTRGYITDIDDSMVIDALGYTPYDASNPDGYITGITTSMVTSALKGATISGALTVSGAFYAGSITHGSDMRYKSKLNDIAEDINVIAAAPFFDFVWKGEDNREYIGTSAQYWLTTKFNNAVLHDKKKDFYSLAYGELGVGIGIINSRAIVSHENRIKVLEAENAALKTELNSLRRRIG